jgi:hypothetical protein
LGSWVYVGVYYFSFPSNVDKKLRKLYVGKQYLEKLKKEQVSIDWAHRVLISIIRQRRMLKMMGIADNSHFNYDDDIELIQFIASEMQKEGLDLNNEENLDSYLNTKFM